MAKKILIVLVVLVVAFVGFVMTRPDTFHVERSATIAAPPATVFPFVNNHKNFTLWSPWEKRDPNQKATFSGPAEGVGAVYHWEGNDDVGKGELKITESKPDTMVKLDLHFIEPFESTSVITYSLAPEGDGTKVTWAMDGNNDFAGKMFGVFMDMDSMLGKDFDEGLAKLKSVAEAKAKEAPPPVGDAPPAPSAVVDGGPAPAAESGAASGASVPSVPPVPPVPPAPTPPG